MPNYNRDTGIAYGVIAGNSLDPDVLNDLMYGADAVDETYEAAAREVRAEAEAHLSEIRAIARENLREVGDDLDEAYDAEVERLLDCDPEDYVQVKLDELADNYQGEESNYSGELEGVKYEVSWLGGAIIVFITESPHTAAVRPCSPCVPGAGDLDSREPIGSGMVCYDVPADWRAKEYE